MGAGEVAVVLAVLAVVTVKAVEFIRKAIPAIAGIWINVVAVAVGTLLAFAFDLRVGAAISELVGATLRPLPGIVEYLIAGVWCATSAGYLADSVGLSDPETRFG